MSVREFLRELLPAEYGISTGFIAYHIADCIEEHEYTEEGVPTYDCRYIAEKDEIRVSSQIDVIIYDALRFGPIVRLGASDVFPLEAVYAYAEVKSIIYAKAAPERRFRLDDSSASLARFKNQLYSALSRYPRPFVHWTPAIHRYYTKDPEVCSIVRLAQPKGEPHKHLQFIFDEESFPKLDS